MCAAVQSFLCHPGIEDSLEAGRLLPEVSPCFVMIVYSYHDDGFLFHFQDQYEVRGDRVVSVSDAPKLARQKRSNGVGHVMY